VLRARPVAGFTPLPLEFVLRIEPEDLRMQRLAEMRVFLAVAFDASRLADVLGGLHRRLRCHGLGNCDGRCRGLRQHGLPPEYRQRRDTQSDRSRRSGLVLGRLHAPLSLRFPRPLLANPCVAVRSLGLPVRRARFPTQSRKRMNLGRNIGIKGNTDTLAGAPPSAGEKQWRRRLELDGSTAARRDVAA